MWDFFPSPEDHLAHRLAALEVFAAGYAGPDDRYLPAGLPDLPFPAGAFAPTLPAHLLFTYPDHLDRDAHLAALQELVRVTRGQVRVFALVDSTLEPCAHLADLRAVPVAEGVASTIRRSRTSSSAEPAPCWSSSGRVRTPGGAP